MTNLVTLQAMYELVKVLVRTGLVYDVLGSFLFSK